MKVQKLFSLDEEIVYNLRKETNASKIVNDLLEDFFAKDPQIKKRNLLRRLQELKQKKKDIEEEETKLDKEFQETQCQTKTILKEEEKNTP